MMDVWGWIVATVRFVDNHWGWVACFLLFMIWVSVDLYIADHVGTIRRELERMKK